MQNQKNAGLENAGPGIQIIHICACVTDTSSRLTCVSLMR